MLKKIAIISIVSILIASSGFFFINGSDNVYGQNSLNGGNVTAVAMTDDSMGNFFVLWSNGNVFEHPDNAASTYWIYLGNSSSIYNYGTNRISLGNPVAIRASLNWFNSKGVNTGLLMVLFSDGYAATMEYGLSTHYWKLTKITTAQNATFVSLAYDLDEYYWASQVNQNPQKTETFYAMESNGIIYAYSDANYQWTEIQSNPLQVNLTSFLVWPNNGPPYGVTTYVGISRSGDIYFAAGNTNPLSPINWTYEGQIKAPNPDFVSITQTPNIYSPYYYYAIMGTPNSYIYATATYNATSSSWSPIANTGTHVTQVAIQNKFYGVKLKADEMILLENGQIYTSSTEGISWKLEYQVPINPIITSNKFVMAWTCSFCTGTFNGMPRINASIIQIEQNRNVFNAISYEFYELNSSAGINPLSVGTLSYSNSTNPYNITPILHKLNLETYPMIISASLSNIETLLSNQTAIDSVINQMVTYALLYNYTGYNIDWEPSTANNSTGVLFSNFLNEFSLQLNKYGRHLSVDIATWNPGFWNFTSIGETNVSYVDVMDYSPVFQGPSSFMQDLQYSISTIPKAKLQVAMINTNVNTNANITPVQMSEFFSALEYLNVSSISMWVLPVNSSVLSMMQQFSQMGNYGKYYIGGEPGSSGFNISAIYNSLNLTEQNNSYINGTLFYSTNLLNSSQINSITLKSNGQIPYQVYIENKNGWSLLSNYSSNTNTTITLPQETFNIRFLFNSSQGFAITNKSEQINFALTGSIMYPGWLKIYQPTNYVDYINGIPLADYNTSYSIYNYGQYSIINITLPPGSYNVTEIGQSGSSNTQIISINSLFTKKIYVQESPAIRGYLKGYISPSTAEITLDGVPISVVNGYFSQNLSQGSYWINATANYYASFSSKVNITSGHVTWINISLTPLPPKPVQLYVPAMINNTTFEISWSEFVGVGFLNYTVYISNVSSSVGKPVAIITNISQTSYNLTNLNYNTTYYVSVRVYSSSGNAMSNVESFTTPLKAHITSTTPKTKTTGMYYYYIYIAVIVVIVVIIAAVLLIYSSRNKGKIKKN